MGIPDVFNIIVDKLNKPGGEIFKNTALKALGIINPLVSDCASVFDIFLTRFDEIKLSCLLSGLSNDLNMEESVNKLYTYVQSSNKRALAVGNIFKETLMSESLKVCVILGYIISKHLDDNSDFTRDELIVCKALENANDYDLENFKKLMENVAQEGDWKGRIKYDSTDSKTILEYELTCDWCVYNRLFAKEMADFGDIDEECLDLSANCYARRGAYILLDLINAVKQIWNY